MVLLTRVPGTGRADHRAVGWSIMWNLSIAQLRGGRSVVLDGVARDAEVGRFREIARDFDVPAVVVWTLCSDREVHRSRIEGRDRAIPGWHELDWAHVDALRTSLAEPVDVDLRLDAVQDLEANATVLAERLTVS